MEVFHEDILETFLFSLIVCFGILQIIVGRRGWRGLCVYGRRILPQINNAIGAACLIFGYAWYFTNPDHMNTRNIEGFMSIFCLALGAAAAFSATFILSSLWAVIERFHRKRGMNWKSRKGRRRPEGWRMARADATCYLMGASEAKESPLIRRLVVTDQEGFSGELLGLLKNVKGSEGVAVLEPNYDVLLGLDEGYPQNASFFLATALEEISEAIGLNDEKVEVVALGAGANLLLAGGEELGRHFPRYMGIAIYPLGREDGLVEDSFKENTVVETVQAALGRGINLSRFREFFNLWLLLLLFSLAISLSVAFIFNIRWKALSGTVIGFVLSLYLLFLYLSVKHPQMLGGRRERLMVGLIKESEEAGSGEGSLRVILMVPPGSSSMKAFLNEGKEYGQARVKTGGNFLEVIHVPEMRSGFLSQPSVVARLLGNNG